MGNVVSSEREILDKIGGAIRAFAKDYDLPTDLSVTAQTELANINVALANLRAFSADGDPDEMKVSATQVEEAWERIRIAATPYARRQTS